MTHLCVQLRHKNRNWRFHIHATWLLRVRATWLIHIRVKWFIRIRVTWSIIHEQLWHKNCAGAFQLSIYEWVMSHMWVNHAPHINTSWHTCVMSHVWMSPVTHMNESCQSYEWAVSRIRMSHVTQSPRKEPRWRLPALYTWKGHVTRMDESCYTYEWVTSHKWMSYVSQLQCKEHSGAFQLYGSDWLLYMCGMIHSYVRHGSLTCWTWPINLCDMPHS